MVILFPLRLSMVSAVKLNISEGILADLDKKLLVFRLYLLKRRDETEVGKYDLVLSLYSSLYIIFPKTDSIFLIYNWDNQQHSLSINVILSEMNGVRCNISEVELSFILQNQTYEPSSFPGGNLSPYGQLQLQINLSTENLYDSIRIVAVGVDENGNNLYESRDFSIEYIPNIEGTYKGDVSGSQNGNSLNMTVTFKIKQEGKNLTGTWVTSANTSGTLEGEFEKSGNKWIFTADVTQNSPIYGLFKADGKIKDYGSYITGSYSGTAGSIYVNANFKVYRK